MALAINPRIPNVVTSQSATLSNYVDQVGWTKAKQHPEVRRVLQVIGTDAVRKIIGDNTWVDLARRKIDDADGPVVITDVRHKNEAVMIQEAGGILIRVTRPGVGPVNGHSSESSITDIRCNCEIVNDGTEFELQNKLIEVATKEFKEKKWTWTTY
jgi:hypothetical protein